MKRELVALARYRFERAHETFRDGVALLEQRSWHSALNRFYYAAFYAARALLALKSLDSSKHTGVITLFGQHFVKSGMIQPEVAKVLRRAFEKRLDVDYEDFAEVTSDEVVRVRQDVQQFIKACEQAFIELVENQKARSKSRQRS